MKFLYLVRHTSVSVDKSVCYGQSDVSVSKTFNEELHVIQQKLSDVKFDKAYTSPLTRCVKLAKNLCRNELNIDTDDRIMEMNFGEWEMLKWDDIERTQMDEWGKDFVNVACPKGESYSDLYHRVLNFYHDITSNNTGVNALIVTHSGVIRSIMSYIKGIDLNKSFEFNIDYGEIVKLDTEHNTLDTL